MITTWTSLLFHNIIPLNKHLLCAHTEVYKKTWRPSLANNQEGYHRPNKQYNPQEKKTKQEVIILDSQASDNLFIANTHPTSHLPEISREPCLFHVFRITPLNCQGGFQTSPWPMVSCLVCHKVLISWETEKIPHFIL